MPTLTVKTVDVDVTETDDLARVVEEAKALGGYLRVEIRVTEPKPDLRGLPDDEPMGEHDWRL